MNDQVNLRSSLHATTQQLNQILSRYSTLASTASTSYSASGVVSTTLLNQKLALEQEYDTSLQLVRSPPFAFHLIVRILMTMVSTVLESD